MKLKRTKRIIYFSLKTIILLSILTIISSSNESIAKGSFESWPSDVANLKRTYLSPDVSMMKLTWKSNPKIEAVDKYAIYGYPIEPQTDERQSGIWIGTTSKNYLEIKLSYVLDEKRGNPFSISGQKKLGSVFWVVAHNKYGWGKNDNLTPNHGAGTGAGFIPYYGLNYLYLEFPCSSKGKLNHAC